MATALGASVHLLHVVEAAVVRGAQRDSSAADMPGLRLHAIRDGYRKLAASAARFSESGGRVTTEVRSGRAPREIVAVAHSRGTDLIVMGTHGRTGLYQVVHGSVAHHVVRHAPCPVLAVRERGMDYTPVTAAGSAVRAS
jgi:nucleotide-binding universal stress UspA family protein